MDYFGAIVIVIAFIYLIKRLHLIENSVKVVRVSKQAVADIKNPELSDDDKEVLVQKHALLLLKLFLILTITAIIALAVPLGLIMAMDYATIMSFDNVVSITLSTWFLILSTVIIVLFFWLINRKT